LNGSNRATYDEYDDSDEVQVLPNCVVVLN